MEKILSKSFYCRNDVVLIARELLGKKIVVYHPKNTVAAIITETEAYAGINDKACHAYGGRRTKRNDVMYHEGGKAYIYLCYGIHYMLNIVTNDTNIPEAVLIRSIIPLKMLSLVNNKKNLKIANGPGKVTKLLGINLIMNGQDLINGNIKLFDIGLEIPNEYVVQTTRIGIDYAEEDSLLPYRFFIKADFFYSECFEKIWKLLVM